MRVDRELLSGVPHPEVLEVGHTDSLLRPTVTDVTKASRRQSLSDSGFRMSPVRCFRVPGNAVAVTGNAVLGLTVRLEPEVRSHSWFHLLGCPERLPHEV